MRARGPPGEGQRHGGGVGDHCRGSPQQAALQQQGAERWEVRDDALEEALGCLGRAGLAREGRAVGRAGLARVAVGAGGVAGECEVGAVMVIRGDAGHAEQR